MNAHAIARTENDIAVEDLTDELSDEALDREPLAPGCNLCHPLCNRGAFEPAK